MTFNSLAFFIFFPVVTIFYFYLPHKWRWLFLLLASCVFYMFLIPVYILILAGTIVIDYIAGILIENSRGHRRKIFLIVSIISNVGVLGFFKYFNFFTSNFNHVASLVHWNYSLPLLAIILPIGLSFHTFQAMSYTIEVYRGKQKAERHFGIYALYVMFFPQLVAGPIERPQNLLHQFYEPHQFEYKRVTDGLKRVGVGLFKKVVIADRLAVLVNHVYGNVHAYSGPSLVLAVIFFSYQIYCDFSGYSDIAIGTAQVLGFNLMENFKRPYYSKSIAEFWRRWHISLSSWFRDYVYIPLGGSRVSLGKWVFNTLVVFMLSGLWHGANWTFVIWGGLHGAMIALSRITEPLRQKAVNFFHLAQTEFYKIFQIGITFLLVSLAWILFRANSLGDAVYVFTHLLAGNWNIFSLNQVRLLLGGMGFTFDAFLLSICAILVLELVQLKQRQNSILEVLAGQPVWLRWGIYYVVVLALLFFGVQGGSKFIYFQF